MRGDPRMRGSYNVSHPTTGPPLWQRACLCVGCLQARSLSQCHRRNPSGLPDLFRILVIDLTHVLNGPFGTTILNDLGARVIKIEPPGHGDDTRT